MKLKLQNYTDEAKKEGRNLVEDQFSTFEDVTVYYDLVDNICQIDLDELKKLDDKLQYLILKKLFVMYDVLPEKSGKYPITKIKPSEFNERENLFDKIFKEVK